MFLVVGTQKKYCVVTLHPVEGCEGSRGQVLLMFPQTLLIEVEGC